MGRPKLIVVDREAIARRIFKTKIAAKKNGEGNQPLLDKFVKENLESGIGDGINLPLDDEAELSAFLQEGQEKMQKKDDKTVRETLTKLVIPEGLEEPRNQADNEEGNKKYGKPSHDFVFDSIQDFINKGVPVQTASILVLAESILELALIHRDKR